MKKSFVLGAAALGALLTATSAVQAILPTRVLTREDMLRVTGATSFPANAAGVAVRGVDEIYVVAVGTGGVTPGVNRVTNFREGGAGSATTSRQLDLPTGAAGLGLAYNSSADLFAFYNTPSANANIYTFTPTSTTPNVLASGGALQTWARNGTTSGTSIPNNFSVDSSGNVTFFSAGGATANTNFRSIGRASSSGISTFITQSDLATAINFGTGGTSATLASFSTLSNGDLVLANSAGYINRYSPSTNTTVTLATPAQLGAGLGGVFTTDNNADVRFVSSFPSILAAPDGLVYFALQGRSSASLNKGIGVIDPSAATPSSTVRLVTDFTEMATAAGQLGLDGSPGAAFIVGQLAWYDNSPAYAVFTAGAPASIGFYVIPEPTALGLLAPAGALLLRRRSR